MASRERLGEDRFVDVYNVDVVRDPVATFEKLYAELGYELNEGLRAKLGDYHRRNAKGAHGSHDYSLEEFGLSDGIVRMAFSEYIDRFGL